MRGCELRGALLLVVGSLLVGPGMRPAAAEQAAPTAPATFQGTIVSDVDRRPVRSADLRITPIDSVRTNPARAGAEVTEVFADSTKPRFASTDSTGSFIVRQLAPGRCLVNVRRLGFEPFEAVLAVDSATVRATFVMRQVSQLLARVVITESTVDGAKLRLDRAGFTWRSKAEPMGRFVSRADILHQTTSFTVADLLDHYFVHDGDPNTYLLDDMPTDYEVLRSYPLSVVVGVEIYPRARPIEYSRVRDTNLRALSESSLRPHALVLIWTSPLAAMGGANTTRQPR